MSKHFANLKMRYPTAAGFLGSHLCDRLLAAP